MLARNLILLSSICFSVLLVADQLTSAATPVQPTSQATSRPNGPSEEIRWKAHSDVEAAKQQLEASKAACSAKVEASQEYQSLTAKIAELETRAKGEVGAAQSKTLTDLATTRLTRAGLKSKALSKDEDVASAKATLQHAQEHLTTVEAQIASAEKARRDAERKAAAEAEKRQAEKDLQERDSKTPEISLSRLEAMGEKYVNQRVRMSDVSFVAVDNTWIDELPGVTIASNGLVSRINVRERDKWIGFFIKNSEHKLFQHMFASKELDGEMLISMKSGQTITVFGTVVELQQSGWYGIVCDKIVSAK